MATADTTRTARVEARIAPEALAVVRRAAELQGRSVSDFLVAAALKDAQRTIEDAQIIRLSSNLPTLPNGMMTESIDVVIRLRSSNTAPAPL